MLFVLIALWGTSIALLSLNWRKASVRWLSAVTFCGGSGALAAVLGDRVIPTIGADQGLLHILLTVQMSASIISYYGLPYTFLMFALYYNDEHISDTLKKVSAFALLIPALLMFIFTPVYTVNHPDLYRLLAVWAVPYTVTGTILCLMKKETQPQLRRTHFVTCLAVLSPVLYSSVMNYLLPALGLYEMWRYNTWAIAFAVVVFVFAVFTYGFLGVRVMIARRQLDSTLRAITSGTAILNHAIKNDIGKMKLFGEKINRHADATQQTELKQDIAVIMDSLAHIRDLISRVHEQTQDIALKPEHHRLNQLLEGHAAALKVYEPNIQAVFEPAAGDPLIYCDRSQLLEVLQNLSVNAIEAMPEGGVLSLRASETKKHIVITLKDTGIGIEKKMLKKVTAPFFTTKANTKENFGLGLSYCYNVMAKHGGHLEINSELGKGTVVTLSFPKRKEVKVESR